jgi:vacuolar-type H+-ATPase subunit I/STV1
VSDVLKGLAVTEASPAAPEAAASGAEIAPEIIVEGEGELRLRDFFAPRLWAAALIPLGFTAITSNMTMVRVSDAISPLGRGTPYEDLFFQAPTIPLLGRHLLPFGLPLTTPTGYGYGTTNILQSNMLVGVLALLIGALLVSAVTRRTNDAIHVAGPYFVYSALCIGLLWNAGKYFQNLTDIFPALLAALLVPMLIGLVAKIIGVWMRNQGWLEADDFATEELAGAGASTRPGDYADTVGRGLGPAPSEAGETQEPLVLRHVSFAKACPFCGNPKITQKSPHACGRCHRNIGLAVEHDELPCPNCSEALVKGAEFCHHCTMWLKAYDEPGLLVEEISAA